MSLVLFYAGHWRVLELGVRAGFLTNRLEQVSTGRCCVFLSLQTTLEINKQSSYISSIECLRIALTRRIDGTKEQQQQQTSPRGQF